MLETRHMPSELSASVQNLLDRLQAHMDAVSEIDATLNQIEAVVGGSNRQRPAPAAGKRPFRRKVTILAPHHASAGAFAAITS